MKRILMASIFCGAIVLCSSQDVQAQELFGIDLDPFNLLSDSNDSSQVNDSLLTAPLRILQPVTEVTTDTVNLYMDLHPGWYLAEEWGIVERNRMFGILE